MRFKRAAAGLVASVMALTAVATPALDNLPVLKNGVSNTASASCLIKIDNPDQNLSSTTDSWLRHLYEVGDETEGVKAVSYDIDYSEITGVRFTITVPETDTFGEEGNRLFWDGAIGGGVVLSFSGGDIERGTELFDTYNWPAKLFWGVTDPELEIFTDPNTDDDPTNDKEISFEKIGAFTYQITANGFTNPIATGDATNVGSIKAVFQEWGSTIANIKITKCEILDADSKAVLTFDENGKKIPNSLPKNTAYMEYADYDWFPSLFDGSGHTVDENNDMTTDWTPGNAEINKSGSYEVSVSNITSTGIDEETGDNTISRLGGDGATVLRVRVTELAKTFGFDYESNKNTFDASDAAALMSLAKNYGVNVSNVKLRQTQTDGTSKNITVNNSKIYFGDLEANGDLIIEIYNEYGSTKNDSPIDTKAINFNDSLTISFDITLPELSEFSYQLYDSNSVLITGYNGSDTDIIIPEKIFNKTVIGISSNAFNGNSKITGVTIPDTVYKIGAKAFYNCTSLKSVDIPTEVTEIGMYAFGYYDDEDNNETKSDNFKISYTKNSYGHLYATKNGFSNEDCLIASYYDNGASVIAYATAGKSYTVPSVIEGEKVYQIYPGAFSDNKTLTSVTLPDGIVEIGGSAFKGCSALTEINIPKSVESIGWNAFEDCTSLKKIVIPDGVDSILFDTFNGCSSLTDIEIPDSVTSIEDNAFRYCTSLTSITIPNGVTSIGNYAFYGCTSLTSITIPNGVTSIGDYAFGYYYDNEYKKIDNFKIYCYSGTVGEQYAKDNGFDYKTVTNKPAKVTGLAFGARSADYVSLKWNKDANADGYIVEYLSGNKFVKLTDKTSGLAVSYKVTGLEAGTLYKFRIRSYVNVHGKRVYGEYSDVLNVRTLPKAMSNLRLGARTDNSISLKWDKNETANGAVVEMYKNGKWEVVSTKTSNTAVSHKITGLKAGTQYKFRVRAYINDEGGRIYSVYNVTLNEVTAPAAVTNFRSVISAKTAIRFNWNKNTAVDGYEIDMAVGSSWVKQATIEGGNSVAYAQTKLAPDTAYRFRIRAYKTVDGKKIYSAYTTASASTAK